MRELFSFLNYVFWTEPNFAAIVVVTGLCGFGYVTYLTLSYLGVF